MDRLWILLFLVICGYGASREIPSEGEDEGNGPDPPLAIVGGTDAADDAWPWQVLLMYRNRFICGGTLIDESTVLTAAHCTYRSKAKKFRVVVGEYDRSKKEKKRGEKKIAVKKIIEHPDYDNTNLDHDMAIMKLKGKVKFNKYIQPIPELADANMDLMSSTCYVTGWGANKGPSSSAKILQELQTPVVTNTQCEGGLDPFYPVTDDMMCTDSEPKGSCYGDSGGPLQCSVNGTWVQAGVVSWGNEDCRTGPSVYSRTSYHRDWILSKM